MEINANQLVKSNVTKDKILYLLESNGATHIQDMGSAFRCTCPLHKGDNPTAFTWDYTNGLWFCFTGSCGGGDIYDFIANIYDMSVEHEFKDVIKKTAEVLGVDIANLELGQRTGNQVRELRAWIEFVSRKNVVLNQTFDLGKLGDVSPLTTFRHYTKETINFFNASYNISMNRIQVPLYNAEGECIGASLRRVNNSEDAKWLHRPKHVNTKHILYNMNNVEVPLCILVEGAFDVWSMKQIGIINALGTLGAHLADEQAELIVKNYVDVLTAFDSDKAGRNATRQTIRKLKNNTNLLHLELGDLHDPGEITSLEQFNSLKQINTYSWINKYGMEGEK